MMEAELLFDFEKQGQISEEENSKLTHLNEALTNVQVSDHQELQPESYRINSPTETLLLAMAENFQRQYLVLNPDRRPLLLCPLNECDIRKFVSTAVRPTLTSHSELQTWQGCASFVADFLSLTPLSPPTELPSQLFSSTSVLRRQKASCFEFSVLLCSLLLGINYNAYCVSGYAVREMCLLDQSRQQCPLLDMEGKSEVSEQKQTENKYGVRRTRNQKSRFLNQQEEKDQEAKGTPLQKQEPQEVKECEPIVDSLRGFRVHCWVLVLSGSSDVQENFFIDPLTGNSYPTDSQLFLGIESIWNNLNYYVNMQDCSRGCSEVNFDLEDLNLWEPVLFSTSSDEEAPQVEQPRVVEMPRSWVGSISISKRDLETRWSKRKKVIRFRKAKLEQFSPNVNEDGLVTRLTSYKDLDCSEEAMVKEWYRNRADFLEEKETNKLDGYTSERFRSEPVSDLLFYRRRLLPSGTEHEMRFDYNREDSLKQRVLLPGEIIESFEDRSDFLYYRHVYFDLKVKSSWESPKVLTVVERFHRDASKPANNDVAERVFLMSERTIELTFHLMDHRFIPSKCSFRIPHTTEKFKRDLVSTFQVDLSVKPLKNLALFRMLNALVDEEKKVRVCIKRLLSEIKDFMRQRETQQEVWAEAQAAAQVSRQGEDLLRPANTEVLWW